MPQGFLTLSKHLNADKVVEAAEAYVGVPWKAGAHSIHGMDCVGLIIRVALDIGLYKEGEVSVPRYTQVPNGAQMLNLLSTYLKRVPQPEHGGLTTFAQRGTGLYHVAVIGNEYLYHADMSNKKVVKISLTEMALKDRRACFVFERPGAA